MSGGWLTSAFCFLLKGPEGGDEMQRGISVQLRVYATVRASGSCRQAAPPHCLTATASRLKVCLEATSTVDAAIFVTASETLHCCSSDSLCHTAA